MKNLDRCNNCILPETFPGVDFNEDGICKYCRKHEETGGPDFDEIRDEVESFVKENIGTSEHYDIVLAFSGGKDSSYTLKYLKEEFNARLIALTIDNDFMSDQAKKNCHNVTEALGVDHLTFKPNPKAMMDVYNTSIEEDIHSTASLKRASSVCNSCIQVINTQILTFASNYDIPIIAGGYIGGQIPSDSGFMKQNLNTTNKMRSHFVDTIDEELQTDASRLFIQKIGERENITVINPMVYLNVSEKEIIEEIRTIDWVPPEDTGAASSNCLLNDYAIHQHIEQNQYHPYVFEKATMVRRRVESRKKALDKITAPLNEEYFAEIEEKLERV